MPAEHLKLVAILFGLVSLALLALAGAAWFRSDERSGLRGGLVLFAVLGAFIGGIWLVAGPMGWSVDRALWVGLGSMVGVLTLARPWWYWDNYRARWLRELIGDEATAAFYLLVAALMVWVGLFTDWTFGRR